MRGKYSIRVQNKKLRYEFMIIRNITIIKGDSATGKTQLVEMVREYYENGQDSGIELTCQVSCGVLEGKNWKNQLSAFHNAILFIDEGNYFVASQEFAEVIQASNNYFVIVTRERLPMLPYSIEEIYGIRNSGKYGSLKRTYNEIYHIYSGETFGEPIRPETIVTEDSNSGFQFFSHVCKENGMSCVSVGGKSKLFSYLLNTQKTNLLVIADGAAIGCEMEKLETLFMKNPKIRFYFPESFEWLILKSGVLEDQEVAAALENPSDYIDSCIFVSWERYFTSLLIYKTRDTYMAYSKNRLPAAYMRSSIAEKIIRVMEHINLGR